MQTYVFDRKQYYAKMKQWGDTRIEGVALPEEPVMPYPLVVAMWCERYSTLLVPGAILDQPIGPWNLVNAALDEYNKAQAALARQK